MSGLFRCHCLTLEHDPHHVWQPDLLQGARFSEACGITDSHP